MPSSEPSPVGAVALERPAWFRELRSYAGHLEHDADAAFAVLLRLLQADPTNAGRLAFEVGERFAVVQGAWWYRGEYRVRAGEVSAEGGGAASVIEFEILNVAARWRRAAPIAGRRVIAESPYVFQRLLSAINDDLDPAGPGFG